MTACATGATSERCGTKETPGRRIRPEKRSPPRPVRRVSAAFRLALCMLVGANCSRLEACRASLRLADDGELEATTWSYPASHSAAFTEYSEFNEGM